jgi:hypothetical protein
MTKAKKTNSNTVVTPVETKKEHYRLIATETPCNSYVPNHWFNFRVLAENEDFETVKAIFDLSFRADSPYGDKFSIVEIINQDDMTVGLRCRLPLQDGTTDYFLILPPHEELDHKIKENCLVPYCVTVNGNLMRGIAFDPRTLLAEGAEDLKTHPVYSEIGSEFAPLTPEQIEKLINNPK